MPVKVTAEWTFHSLKLVERETVYVASSSRCGSEMCPGQSFTEISDWNSSNACHVLWELPHVPQRHSSLLTDATGQEGFLSTLPNLLSQLDNLLAVSKQWMCIKIYLRRKICSSFVLPCNVFTDYLFNCTPLAYLFMCHNKYVILRLLLMVIFLK